MSRAGTTTLWQEAASAWREHAIPWLMSASVHCGILIVLGLFVAQGAFLSTGSGSGHDLTSTVYTSHISTDYYDDDASSLGTPDGDPSLPPQVAEAAAGDGSSASESAADHAGSGGASGTAQVRSTQC